MAYTYLITGATSDVGRALIERLLADAPADTTVLAQGCGDLEKLADLCARFPGQVRPFDVDLSDRAKVDTFVQVLASSAPAPTHFIHLPALPVVNAKFKAFDQTRFDRDLEIQVHSAVRLCRAVLPSAAACTIRSGVSFKKFVSIILGATQLTVMPKRAYSTARLLTRPPMALLAMT